MKLMKWFRKHKSQIMVGVIGIAIVGFIGTSYITSLVQRNTAINDLIGTYLGEEKLIANDLRIAEQELQILKLLRADLLLQNFPVPLLQAPNLNGIFLSQLLFGSEGNSAQVASQIKRLSANMDYALGQEQISEVYTSGVPSRVLWYLLDQEANRSGISISNEECKTHLSQLIPAIAQGETYQSFMSQLVGKENLSEDMILQTFGKLLSIYKYADFITAKENVTLKQIAYDVSHQLETMDFSFVPLHAETFSEDVDEPTEAEIQKQFEAYKEQYRGNPTADNPYGFGYKLYDRVALECLIVKLDDVREAVDKPTAEELESFYAKNRQRFVEQIPEDPNDPNSPTRERIRSFAEVAYAIERGIIQERTRYAADRLILDAQKITEGDIDKPGVNRSELTGEDFSEAAVAYEQAAEQLTEKHNVPVYTSTTGFLNAADITMDAYLGTLVQGSQGYDSTPLIELVFSVEELSNDKKNGNRVRLYEGIGPLQDMYGRVVALVRVIDVKPESVPESADTRFSIAGVIVDEPQPEQKEVFTLREKIVEDLKFVKAFPIAVKRANEFAKEVENSDWDTALETFNDRFPPDDANDPNRFRIVKRQKLPRYTSLQLYAQEVRNEGLPNKDLMLRNLQGEKLFRDAIYSMMPADSNSLAQTPKIMEFKPRFSVLVFKDLSSNMIYREDYMSIKSLKAYQTDMLSSQSLAAIHFNPRNILERMEFQWKEEDEETEEPAEKSDKPSDA